LRGIIGCVRQLIFSPVGLHDGSFRASPNGAFLDQIYGNASKPVGYTVQPDGKLDQITSVGIPYNSPQGLAEF
jgi:hypothetical protein